MTPRIEYISVPCDIYSCKRDATQRLIDGYGKHVGNYCGAHCVEMYRTVVEYEQRRRFATTGDPNG